MKDVSYAAAFPKSGIAYLNFMLFQVLFDRPEDTGHIDSNYIFDLHESLSRVPPPGQAPCYTKIHFPYGPNLPLLQRANRVVYIWRDPVDVMMSVWDFKHLLGKDGLPDASPAQEAAIFQRLCQHWLTTGGMIYPWAGSWKSNATSWLDQTELPRLVVRYEQLKVLQRIIRFLRRDASEERIRAAVAAGKRENMRKIEADEIKPGTSGVFYRPALAPGYSHGYRFVGRMNGESADKILTAAPRQYAGQVFGPVLERARALAR